MEIIDVYKYEITVIIIKVNYVYYYDNYNVFLQNNSAKGREYRVLFLNKSYFACRSQVTTALSGHFLQVQVTSH